MKRVIFKETVVLRRGGGREGVVLHDSFFYQLILQSKYAEKMTLRQWWEHSNVKTEITRE